MQLEQQLPCWWSRAANSSVYQSLYNLMGVVIAYPISLFKGGCEKVQLFLLFL